MTTEEESQSIEIANYTGRKMAAKFCKRVTVDLTAKEDDIEENCILGKRTIKSNAHYYQCAYFHQSRAFNS